MLFARLRGQAMAPSFAGWIEHRDHAGGMHCCSGLVGVAVIKVGCQAGVHEVHEDLQGTKEMTLNPEPLSHIFSCTRAV